MSDQYDPSSDQSAGSDDAIQRGDVVKFEVPSGNGFIEADVVAVEDDGTVVARDNWGETHKLAHEEVMDSYAVEWR